MTQGMSFMHGVAIIYVCINVSACVQSQLSMILPGQTTDHPASKF